jgi:hypothetical protein
MGLPVFPPLYNGQGRPRFLERDGRIELPTLDWKSKVIPFYESRLTWSEYKDSNLGPPGPKPGALPDCATLRINLLLYAVCKELL